jgi:curved DNA-binding protein
MAKDYYKILGITLSATASDISKAFKQAARRHHPDLNPGRNEAEERFKEINEAYEILSDPLKKRDYDRRYGDLFGRHMPDPASAPPPAADRKRSTYGFRDLGEIFEDVFGEGSRSQSEPLVLEGNDILIRLSIEFEEAALGCEKLVKLSDKKRVRVRIPGGVEAGSYVRVPGMGEKGKNSGRDGDLLLEIDVRPHRRFERKGDHIAVRVDLPLRVALCGGKIGVPTLEGDVVLTVPAGTQGNAEFRFRGKGAFNLKTKKRGDVLIAVDICYPDKLGAKDRDDLRRILERNGG